MSGQTSNRPIVYSSRNQPSDVLCVEVDKVSVRIVNYTGREFVIVTDLTIHHKRNHMRDCHIN